MTKHQTSEKKTAELAISPSEAKISKDSVPDTFMERDQSRTLYFFRQ
jgi:hypothetical protein